MITYGTRNKIKKKEGWLTKENANALAPKAQEWICGRTLNIQGGWERIEFNSV